MSAIVTPQYLRPELIRRFTVDEYHKLIKHGILVEGEPTELLEGYLIRKMPRGVSHDAAVQRLTKRVIRMLPAAWDARVKSAITLTGDSEPEPDLVAVRGDGNTYHDHHPGPSEIGLLIEVSDSSLLVDREDKGSIYAREGIPVYWVVNVVDKVIEVYTQPGGPAENPAYQKREDFAPGGTVPVVLDGTTIGSIPVADVLG